MRFKILASLTLSAMLAGFSGCAKDNAIVNPNSPTSQVPLATLIGITVGFDSLPILAKANVTNPMQIIQESNHIKLIVGWYPAEIKTDTMVLEIKELKKEWPLRFSADIFAPPPANAMISIDQNHPESKMGIAQIELMNDNNNDGKMDFGLTLDYLNYFDSLKTVYGDNVDNWPDSVLNSLSEYIFLRSSNKDWLIGASKYHWLLYCTDQNAANILQQNLSTPRPYPPVVGNLHSGYNLLKVTLMDAYNENNDKIQVVISEPVEFSEEIQILVTDDLNVYNEMLALPSIIYETP